ncbi:hypothetical protein [Natrinema sp. DC36]|uniref:hypothetical protein n=1 Tax=Natrinema sp. DC36 TaxID=2878680 RepID=UPI001CF071AB|nr:hypothetical protein [Natrinema sp. DC36]
MDLRIRGLADLEDRLETAADRIGEFRAGTHVSFSEFFSDAFMRDHTQFDSFAAFCEASPWSLEESRDIQHVDRQQLDAYVADATAFENWDAMKTQAAEAEIIERVVSDPS